jgi:hypothetical protein
MGTQSIITVSKETQIKMSIGLLWTILAGVAVGAGFAYDIKSDVKLLLKAEAENRKEIEEHKGDIIRIKAHLGIGSANAGSFDHVSNR